MKKTILVILLTATTLSTFAFMALTLNWNLDPNYSIKFSGKNAQGTVSGLTGVVIFEPTDLQNSKIEVVVDATSIKTGNSTKDKHAKNESWLNVTKYPTIKFTSNSITKESNDFLVNGTLQMHGITKQLSIPFRFSQTNGKGLFTGSFKVNRKNYGVKGNFFDFAVGDEFNVELRIPVSKNN